MRMSTKQSLSFRCRGSWWCLFSPEQFRVTVNKDPKGMVKKMPLSATCCTGLVRGCWRGRHLLMSSGRRSKQRVLSPFLKSGQSSLGSIFVCHITGNSRVQYIFSEYKWTCVISVDVRTYTGLHSYFSTNVCPAPAKCWSLTGWRSLWHAFNLLSQALQSWLGFATNMCKLCYECFKWHFHAYSSWLLINMQKCPYI